MDDNSYNLEIKDRLNLTDQVYRALKEGIVSGGLTPGTRLVEEQLSSTLKVSKTPLREAMSVLEREGLIESFPYQGRYVACMTPRQIKEIYAVRESLEGLAARLAAELATPELGRKLQESLERSQAATETGRMDEFLANDRKFHELLATAADNQTLKEMLQLLHDQVMLAQVTSFLKLQRRHESIKEHTAVLEAVIARDSGQAEQAMRQHVHNLAAAYQGFKCNSCEECSYREKKGGDHACADCPFIHQENVDCEECSYREKKGGEHACADCPFIHQENVDS